MIVVSEMTLKELMMQIVSATHSLTDVNGGRVSIGTIAEPQLRMAALVALESAIGRSIHPGDERIPIPRRSFSSGIFQEE